MPHFAVTAVGLDRPGIVAAITGALHDLGCNLEDTSMSILRGHFAMVLIVSGGADIDGASVVAALSRPAGELGMTVSVGEVGDDTPSGPTGDRWTVSVYGADQPGIVHRVTEVLARAGANIVDLTTRVIGEPSRPVYAMVIEVALPESVDAPRLTADLDALAAELGIDCNLHLSDADIL